jgi:hypothetical protein
MASVVSPKENFQDVSGRVEKAEGTCGFAAISVAAPGRPRQASVGFLPRPNHWQVFLL